MPAAARRSALVWAKRARPEERKWMSAPSDALAGEKRQPQHEGGLDRHIRILRLAAWSRGGAYHLIARPSHSVRLPRRRRPASYDAQFLTLNFIFPK